MRHVLVALVQDEPGVLARMGILFARRGYNVESFTAGASELPGHDPHHHRGRGRRAPCSTRSPSSSAS